MITFDTDEHGYVTATLAIETPRGTIAATAYAKTKQAARSQVEAQRATLYEVLTAYGIDAEHLNARRGAQ